MRNYSNTAVPTSLSDGIDDEVTSIPVVSTTGFPTPPFTAAINQGTVNEEIILVSAMNATNFTTVTRGYDDTTARAALVGDDVLHVVVALDYAEAAEHRESLASDHLPPGVGMPFFGADNVIPQGWLYCDGAEVSRVTYAALFAVIGTDFGEGNGSTTFNLPDGRGRTFIGVDEAEEVVSGATVPGATGGYEMVALTVDQLAVHTHVQNAHTHTTQPHSHKRPSWSWTGEWDQSGSWWWWWDQFWYGTAVSPEVDSGLSSTTVTVNGATAVNQNTGGGEEHTNMQPWLAGNWIIKT